MIRSMPNLGSRVILVTALIAPSGAFAASACKGLEQTLCEGKTECRWIKGYKKQNGTEVAGYCRSSQKKTESDQTTGVTPPPTDKQ